ncbi:MAG: ABC transporter permease [Bacilli bacterium]|mgnify:CR=1 FL=1|nr:ABC transporter permease [Bacilli bacterium]
MELLLSTVSFLLVYASIITIVGFGGMFSEKSGTIALSLEGSMTIGALAGCIVMFVLPEAFPMWLAVILVLLASIVAGLLYSMLLAVASITFKANQTLVGTALNILATAISVVIAKVVTSNESNPAGQSRIYYTRFYEVFNIPFFGNETVKFNWLVIIVLLLIPLTWFILNKTSFGLRLSSCGENPQASDSLGVNVAKTRYIGVGLSGIFAGFGGLVLALTGGEWEFASGANGFGFLALAVIIFGQWKPIMIFIGALIFGLFKTVSVVYPSIDFLASLGISSYFYLALPYVVCLIVLIFTSKKSSGPKAAGVPYDKGKR